jgi:hypothetical protein
LPDALLLCLQPVSSALLLPPSALLLLQHTTCLCTGLLQRPAAGGGLIIDHDWPLKLFCRRLLASELPSEESCMMCQSKAVAAIDNTRWYGKGRSGPERDASSHIAMANACAHPCACHAFSHLHLGRYASCVRPTPMARQLPTQ